MRKRLKAGVLWIKKMFRQIGTMGEIYLFNMFLILLAFVMIAVIVNVRFSQQNKSHIMDYNYSALKGIDSLLDQQESEFMEIVRSIYMDASEENSVLSYLASENGDSQMQLQYPITSFLFDVGNSSYSAQAIYHAEQGLAYVRKDGKIALYREPDDALKGMIEVYEDTKSRLLMLPSTFSSGGGKGGSYAMIYGIRDQESYANVGAIQIEFKTKVLDLLLQNSYPSVMGDFLIVSEDGAVFYDTTGKWYGETYTDIAKLLESENNTKAITLSDGKYYINSFNKGVEFYPELHIYGLVSFEDVNKGLSGTLTFIASILITIFVLFSIATFLNIYKKTVVLKRIHGGMKSVQQGNLDVRVDTTGMPQNELTDIANSFNKMTVKLNSHIQQEYRMKLEKQEYMLMALQAQMNPHFLYNAFEAIRMKAMLSGEEEIEKMIILLSKILRNAVKEDNILTIRQEAQNCENYLQFHKIRFKEQLSYAVEIAEEIENYAIVCHTMQVIVENYMVHSFDSSRDDNCISIVGKKEGDWVSLTVSDNSQGITQEKLAEIRSYVNNVENASRRKHIGLSNVSKSMSIIFGEDFHFLIDLMENGGLSQTLRFRACTLEEMRNAVQSDDSGR